MGRYLRIIGCLEPKRTGFALLWLGCILLVICPVLRLQAQEFRGIITGQVTDPRSAVLPNATVIATGPQQSYKTTTTAKGDFTIPLIQPGIYTVSVEADGFTRAKQLGINSQTSRVSSGSTKTASCR